MSPRDHISSVLCSRPGPGSDWVTRALILLIDKLIIDSELNGFWWKGVVM